MKYTKEQRLEIGRKIHESGLSNFNAGIAFGISDESARRYRIMYEQSQAIEHAPVKSHSSHINKEALINVGEPLSSDDYSSMSREELIEELMKSRIREARLKKGYLVKGVGAEKEYILLDNKSTR